MSLTVRDAAIFLQALAGPDSRDVNTIKQQPPDYLAGLESGVRGLRMAWSSTLGYATVDTEVEKISSQAARVFEELGATVDEPSLILEEPFSQLGPIASANSHASYGHFLDERADDLTDYARARLQGGREVTGLIYARGLRALELLKFQMATFFEDYDLLLTPTMAVPAFPVDQYPATIAGRSVVPDWAFNPYNFVFNMTGQPAASIPCGFSSEGLPIGLHVVGRMGDEATVLRASAAFEGAHPWSGRVAPVS